MSLEVWREPDGMHAYVMGVDTAEGVGHGDYSCSQVVGRGAARRMRWRWK